MENDNFPKWDRIKYTKSVGEDLKPGSSIITVRATDKDTGKNGKIEYGILSQ